MFYPKSRNSGPNLVTAAIIYKSFGNPGWTLLILKSLLDNHIIDIVTKGEGQSSKKSKQLSQSNYFLDSFGILLSFFRPF